MLIVQTIEHVQGIFQMPATRYRPAMPYRRATNGVAELVRQNAHLTKMVDELTTDNEKLQVEIDQLQEFTDGKLGVIS